MKKIMFSDLYGLTQAVLDGRKTQTRRICKEQHWSFSDLINANENDSFIFEQPKYRVGEVVAVAQSYRDLFPNGSIAIPAHVGWFNKLFVKANEMPHRIRITDVRVERLQDISEEDCLAEGVVEENIYGDPEPQMYEKTEYRVYYYNRGRYCALVGNTPREAYATLIDKIAGKGTWESNPYVFVYEFELVK